MIMGRSNSNHKKLKDTMKLFITLSLLCMVFTNAMYAQPRTTDLKALNKRVENAVMKKVREAEANQKKAAEEA